MFKYTVDLDSEDWLRDGSDSDDYKCRLVDELALRSSDMQGYSRNLCADTHARTNTLDLT